MNTFASAVENQEARTVNGMKARKSTASSCVDLFFKIGASRGQNVIPNYVAASVEDKELAVRIALWARDVRSGAGEREVFRKILNYMTVHDPVLAERVVSKVPELGRWDDLLVLPEGDVKQKAYQLILNALNGGNGLCAKWMPRKGEQAARLRKFLGWSPKYYRKRLVELTKVVEQQMCAKEWDQINFSHVPSVAAARYKKAFIRNAGEHYSKYVQSLVKGDDPKVKINAGAIFPHDVIKEINRSFGYYRQPSKTELDVIEQQWNALPNYVGDRNILAVVDVSGSMATTIPKTSVTAMDIAVSLGLYTADKNKGKFKDLFCTFSARPSLHKVKGTIVEKINQIQRSDWGMNTDLIKAMELILDVAVKGNVPQNEMPEILLVMSDMQFDQCTKFDHSAIEAINFRFEQKGYQTPRVVFWNIVAHDNVPVKYNKNGVALVSGYSPSILKSILSSSLEDFTPENIMLNTVMDSRYDF